MAGAIVPTGAVVAMSERRRLLAGIVLAFSNFMVVLDLTIANVSIPAISGNLGISLDQGTWVITSYAVAEGVVVPLTGWLAERYGVVRVFLLALLGFGIFSALCGLSTTLGMIVACRIGQGLCGGPLMPMSQTLMARIYPPERQGTAMGLWAVTVMLAPALGPILGGYITDGFSWRWIFLINVPLALICAGAGFALLRKAETQRRRVPIDAVGLGLLVFWITCLQVMLDNGHDRGWFDDELIVVLALMALVGFVAFVIWELTDEHPVVDLRVFRHRGFGPAVVAMCAGFGAFFSGVVLVPQWLQVTLGYTAFNAGLATAVPAFSSMLVAPIVVRLAARADPRLLACGGILWIGAMISVRTLWTSNTDFTGIAIPLFLQGLGMPFMFMPLTMLLQNIVPREEAASGAGMQNFARTMAIALATALILTVWSDGQAVARTALASAMHPDMADAALGAMGMNDGARRAMMSLMVDREAMTLAANRAYLFSALATLLAAGLVWMIPRPSPERLASSQPGGH